MYKFICKYSITCPLFTIWAMMIDPQTISIVELGLYLERFEFLFLYIMMSVFWLCCSPFRKSCCNGSLMEVFFNILPVEVMATVYLAQHHFWITILLIASMVFVQGLLIWAVYKKESQYEFSEKRYRRCVRGLQRGVVMISAITLFIPCSISLFVYGMQEPAYTAEKELGEVLLKEQNKEQVAVEVDSDPYIKNKTLLLHFDDANWETLDVQERITIAQEFVDFQSELLGISPISLTAKNLGSFILGEYDDENNEIWIDIEQLADSPAEACIRTLCHEIWHSAQYYLISNIDWESPVFQSAYFKELRAWKENDENYQDAYSDGYDSYQKQPLEESARVYATEETERVQSYIHLFKQENAESDI